MSIREEWENRLGRAGEETEKMKIQRDSKTIDLYFKKKAFV